MPPKGPTGPARPRRTQSSKPLYPKVLRHSGLVLDGCRIIAYILKQLEATPIKADPVNYIKRLETENAEHAATRSAVAFQIHDMIAYLSSPKFTTDEYVNRNDLLEKLLSMRTELAVQ